MQFRRYRQSLHLDFAAKPFKLSSPLSISGVKGTIFSRIAWPSRQQILTKFVLDFERDQCGGGVIPKEPFVSLTKGQSRCCRLSYGGPL